MRSLYHQGLEVKFHGPTEAKVRLYVPPAGAHTGGARTTLRFQQIRANNQWTYKTTAMLVLGFVR